MESVNFTGFQYFNVGLVHASYSVNEYPLNQKKKKLVQPDYHGKLDQVNEFKRQTFALFLRGSIAIFPNIELCILPLNIL